MNISDFGVAFIKGYEKLRLSAYKPTPDDVWTCGYGSTKGVTEDTVWTQDEAEQHLREDISNAETCVNKRIAGISITQNQFDALVSFCFNVGCGAFSGSTLLVKLLNGDDDGAAEQFGRWNRQGNKVLDGLTKRRAAEAELFRS